MSRVTHVHASPGEYIHVHRGGSSDDCLGLLTLFLIGGTALTIFVIVYIDTVVWVSSIAYGGYIVCRYYKEIWKFICWSVKLVWTVLTYIVKGIGYVISKLMSLFKSTKPQPPAAQYGKDDPNYGKILQDYDWN